MPLPTSPGPASHPRNSPTICFTRREWRASNGGRFGEYGDGYIRFSYANSLPNLMEAVQRIQKVSSRREAAVVAK